MDINFIGGYNDQKYGLLFVFSHKDKKNWQLFKVPAESIPFLNNSVPKEPDVNATDTTVSTDAPQAEASTQEV
jgi:hypothetical protein